MALKTAAILGLFLTTVLGYDVTHSKYVDKLACITHCSQSQIEDWSCKICSSTDNSMTDVKHIINPATNTMCFVGYSASTNKIVVSWRGTKDFKNWLEDFAFQLVDYSKCRKCQVHQGFYFDYKSVESQIIGHIETILKKAPTAEMLVTGSSLGSALASICALELQLKYRKVSELHTFGCPRVGNHQFSDYLSTNIQERVRVVHNRDIVPHVPFLSLGYHHYANQVLFDQEMVAYTVCNDSGEDPKCSNRFDPNYSVDDHITYWIKPHDDIC